MASYIVLTSSSGSPSYKFPVIEGGWKPVKEKAQTENETIGGIDVHMGLVHEVHEYVIKTYESRWAITSSGSYRMCDDDYGVLSDLEWFYDLNDPYGTPTNVITLTDHYGDNHYCYFVGQFSSAPSTVIIEGGFARYLTPCRFRIIPT